jgi:transposase
VEDEQLLMRQRDRDRLVVLRRAGKGEITQAEAARELGVTLRHVKRLVKRLRVEGDKSVIHGLRGKASPRRIAPEIRERAVALLSEPVYAGFGPTLASEYLGERHGIEASKETVRKWMKEAGLWKARRAKLEMAHVWRPRRSRCGELVQWDTSDHDWLEGRGERLHLIGMVDDATSRYLARFVRQDSTEENMGLLRAYLERHGRPLAFYTDKASLFQSAPKAARGEKELPRDEREPLPPTQIGRALRELGIVWIPAHSPQAKGRVERTFGTAQDRLVKGLRVAGAKTLEEANAYLEREFLPWWNRTLTVKPASASDAHRPLGKEHDLAAVLSHVETRQVANGYVVSYGGQSYRIDRRDVKPGLRGSAVRVEQRWDGTIAMRSGARYLRIQACEKPEPAQAKKPPARAKRASNAGGRSRWMKNFFQRPAMPLGKALAIANATS